MIVYCDSGIIMYYLEGDAPFRARATSRLAALRTAGDTIAFSDLVRLECRILPIRNGDAPLLAIYDAFFGLPGMLWVPMSTAVFDRATSIRAVYGFAVADSLHLAAAIEGGCDSFLTNDLRLARCTDIFVEILP